MFFSNNLAVLPLSSLLANNRPFSANNHILNSRSEEIGVKMMI